MRCLLVAALLALSSSASAESLIRITQGTGGELDETRLYVVDYDCGSKDSQLLELTKALYGFGVFTDITTNFGSEIKSKNAAANPAAADTASIFSANVLTYRYYVLGGGVQEPKHGACSGQFFIKGSENYSIIGKAGYTETSTLGDLAAKIATLVVTGASALYPLVRMTKPVEFDNRVNQARDIIKDLNDFQALFHVSNADSIEQPKDLKVGINSVIAYDAHNNRIAWQTFNVSPVVSLVRSKNTKFLKAYQATAIQTAIDLTGSDDDLRGRCIDAKQSYISSGFQDASDLAYLMYQRLLFSKAPPEKTTKCMGQRAIAQAALELLNQQKSPIVATSELRISQDDIDNYLPIVPDSKQPHPRAKLEQEMSTFLDELDRHLQSESGLVGQQLAHLLDDFTAQVTIEDRTTDYKALKLIAPGPAVDTITVTREEFLSKLKKAGMIRWLCVQRTKRDAVGAPVRYYDPDIDSAVMVIAAKAGANEELDFNKTTFFGVDLLFAPAKITDRLHLNKLVFEQRFRDAILKENAAICGIKNAPVK